MKPAPQFFCYGPRPAHADLPPLERAVLQVLKDARGIFINMGMTPSLICGMVFAQATTKERPLAEALALDALRELERGGFVEHPPMRPERWRAKK
jgi:hypothetical protein